MSPFDRDLAKLVQERKEQSILAALVFGCSCGETWEHEQQCVVLARLEVWLRNHTRCAGLGAMVREDA